MDASATSKILYLVCLLLMTFNLLTWVHSQGDVWFSLRNKTYQNNSCVTLEDIGEGEDALLCMTNLATCCQASYSGTGSALGNWYFPNGTTISRKIVNVPSEVQRDIYQSRDQSVVLLNRRRGGVAGIYSCEIPDSTNVTQSIYVGVYTSRSGAGDVWFSLRGTTYQNNSCVALEDIGEDDDALLCMTNFTACCKHPRTGENGSGLGMWYFPNGTTIESNKATREELDFYETRDQHEVRLNRRRGKVEGNYRCEIPDSMNVTQTIYIGVYTASSVVDCGSLTAPANGQVDHTSETTFRQTATYSCNTGYNLVGNRTRTCQATGEWSESEPTCQIVDCGSLTDPASGQVTHTAGTTFEQNATYSCNTGYNLVGNSTRTCQATGVWSGSAPTCQIVDCGSLTDPPNGQVTLTATTFGQTATHSCNTGYNLVGNSIRSCQATGNWSQSAPTCDVVDCGSLADPANGQVNHNAGTTFGQTATYSCITGYTLVGESIHTCQATGNWSGSAPTCQILTSEEATLPLTVGATTTTGTIPKTTSPLTAATTGTAPVSSTQPIKTVGATATTRTVPVSISTQPFKTVGATATTGNVPVSSSIQPTLTVGTTATTGTVLVNSSTQPTNNSPSDGATTTPVIIVVAVVIILVVIVVGVVILVVLFRAKKRKQQLEINKLQNVTEDIEMKLKQEGIEKEAVHPPYTIMQTKGPPNVPSKSEELVDYLNRSSTLPGEYSEIELVQDDRQHVLPAKPPRRMNYSNPMSKDTESNPGYHDVDQHCDPSTSTNVVQRNDIYTVPDATNSYTVEAGSETYETVYSEPIQPSLFADADRTPSDSQNAQPYAPIYTVPTDLPRSEEVVLKVFRRNIREIRELGMGLFGKVILAETVGLSMKDLRLSESDDDKSKSTVVAVKKLKSDAPNATKEAFEKEVNFMSRLTDRNVIRILGVCYEDAPFIMMEYMEKGDLNQYLQKFKSLSSTDSESQGQITTKTMVHMTTQIASAMKYLASHNFVHRDLATRNCLVGHNYLVKLSDFGMSRSLYDSHYYRIHGRFSLPVRWVAYECFYGKFSQKSDVWAFGVTMWEIFTLAKEQPYNNMSDMQVIEDALKGKNRKILPKPDMCPLKVYKIMLECWEHNSDQRATFDELLQLLTSFHSNL